MIGGDMMEMDYGRFIIKYESCYQDIVHTLISNGYEVTVSYDSMRNIITIEFKKNRMED